MSRPQMPASTPRGAEILSRINERFGTLNKAAAKTKVSFLTLWRIIHDPHYKPIERTLKKLKRHKLLAS